jgi:hypothetical protein
LKPKAEAFEVEKDDPLIIAVISLSIVIVAGILVAVLSAYCCKRCHYRQPSGSVRGSPGTNVIKLFSSH